MAPWREEKSDSPRRWGLGYRELAVLKLLAQNYGELPSTEIYSELCGNNESCKKSTQIAIRRLKIKGWVRRTKRNNRFIIKITREGKKRLLELVGKL